MNINDLKNNESFFLLNDGGNGDTKISEPYCCDLLSIAMGNVPANSAWVTVMSNLNTLAVASLTDCACVIFACGVKPDETILSKAQEEGISIFSTNLPVFETALEVYNCIK